MEKCIEQIYYLIFQGFDCKYNIIFDVKRQKIRLWEDMDCEYIEYYAHVQEYISYLAKGTSINDIALVGITEWKKLNDRRDK